MAEYDTNIKNCKVGSFYCLGDHIVYMSMGLKCLPENRFSYNYSGHDNIWQIFTTQMDDYRYYSELDDTYYFPRGRIIYRADTGRFVIFIDPKAYSEKMIKKLLTIYEIPHDLYDVITEDEHYNVSTQPISDIDPDELSEDVDIDRFVRERYNISENDYHDAGTRHKYISILTGNEYND